MVLSSEAGPLRERVSPAGFCEFSSWLFWGVGESCGGEVAVLLAGTWVGIAMASPMPSWCWP